MTTENNQMDISQEEEVPLVEAAAPEGETGVDPILGRGEIETTHHEGGRGEEEEEEEESLEDYAEMVVTILQPVAITMLLVVWMVRLMNASNIVIVASQAIYQVYTEEDDDGTATKLFGSILNALIFLAIIIAVTVLFVILYKYRCLKIIYAWLITSTGMLLAVFGGYLFSIVLEATNVALDWISYSFILWNFSIVGIMSIFWHAPQKVTQGYLIVISGLMAVWFTRLPEWTTWAILGVVAIYDLFAVLCPRGPLKVLVETAQERQEPIPALLYNASAFIMMAEPGDRQNSSRSHTILDEDEENENNNDNDNENTENRNNNSSIIINNNNNNNEAANPNAPQEQEERGKGVKLGLGDFVFYSVLMGRAALFDMITVFTCFVAIITGLFATLLLLAIFRKALPALPISIALGIIFYFLTSSILWPFALTIGKAQIFV